MKSPKQWLRLRLYNFVLNSVGDVVRPSDLIRLAAQLEEIRDDATTLRTQLADTSWQRHIESVTSDIGNHLNSVHEEVKNIGNHLNSVHEEVRDGYKTLMAMIESVQHLQHKVAVQEAQIRAKPFLTGSIEIPSSRDGRPTLGYEVSGGGNYLGFLEKFRPSFDELLSRLEYVATWLPSSGAAVDLGAGRGEMVKIMRDHGLVTYGIDADLSVVSAARERDIDVRHQDIDNFLSTEAKSDLDVITAIQVVEHVDTMKLEQWFKKIQQLLKPGGVFVAETPNPHAIDAFKAFWIDTTHVRPYYPESLLHMAKIAGFVSAEIWVEGSQESIDDRLGVAGSYTLIAVA